MAEDNKSDQNPENETTTPEGRAPTEGPPVAGFLTANQALHEDERDKMTRVANKQAKKQQEDFERQQAEAAEKAEKAEQDNKSALEIDDADQSEPLPIAAANDTQESDTQESEQTTQPLDASAPEALVDDETSPQAKEADEEEFIFDDDMSEEDRQEYLDNLNAANKAAEKEANTQDEANDGHPMTVSQALRQLYEIPYTTPAFEQRAKEHDYQLMGLNFDPDQEERPLNVGIKLTETFAEVSVARTLTPSGITAQTAYELAQIASLNPAIKEHGVVLIGTEEDMQLLYQAAKAFNLKIADEEKLPKNITDAEPAQWEEFMNTVPTPTVNTEEMSTEPQEETAQEEPEEEPEEEKTGYEHEEALLSEAQEGEALKTATAQEAQEEATADQDVEVAEVAQAPETEDTDAQAPQETSTEQSSADEPELLGNDDDEHGGYLREVRELTKEFNRVGVTPNLYNDARDYVLDTGKVSRKRLRDKFYIGATKASVILKGLELEGVVEKTGANGRRVIPENERKQVFS